MLPRCALSPHKRKDHRTSPRDGVGVDCSSSQLHIQEDSSFLENRDWHNCLYLANSSFKIHSFDLFGYEIAARQQNMNHQWKFFLQEGGWFNWPWNWELLLRVSCPLSWEFKWRKQENRVQIVANPSIIFLISQKTRGFIVSGTNFLSRENSNRNHCWPGIENPL